MKLGMLVVVVLLMLVLVVKCFSTSGADTEKLERHIFRMYDSNKVSWSNRRMVFRKYFEKYSEWYSKCMTLIRWEAE